MEEFDEAYSDSLTLVGSKDLEDIRNERIFRYYKR
jgi:hypothetical protein